MMDYGLFLYADLATGERIEILKRDFGGAPRKIAALSSWSWRPLDNDSAEVTDTPIVKGTLSLSIKDMRDFDYTAFFTVDSTLWRVVLKYGGVVRWSGYVQPESYSSNSEYRSDINIMALDNLGQLEYIEYNYFDSSFVSLRTLVSKACELVGWNFAPVIFDTRVVSGEGILIEDAVLNVETFRKKTWWEVLSDVLFSFGLQLAYFDDNAYRISSVANKFDATRIVDIPSYTIESGCTSDIVPPWKSASVEQNLQIINDFFYFPSGSDYSVVGSYIINAYNSKYEGISGIPLTDWSLISSKINTLKPNNWQDNDCRTFSGQSVLNDKTGALYLETIIKETDPTTLASFVSKQIDIPTVLAGASIELSLSNREWYVLWEDYDYSDFTEDNPLAIRGYAQKFAPWVVQNFEIQYSFQMLYTYIDNDGVQQTIIFKEYWEKLSESNKDSRVEFTITPKKDTEVSDEKYTINIDSFPSQGSLELKIFRPKLLNTGSVVKEGATSFCRISDIKMATLPKIEIGSTKTNVGIIKSARTKKDLSLSYGELPPKYTCVDYAGGVFQNVRFNPSLHDWHRADNLGGVLPLSEIVWRGYVHHFSRFQTNAGEPAGGKVLRGRFPFEGLKLNNTLKYSTKEFAEYYVINSASITGREADLTLMQVKPYTHIGGLVIEDAVETGGGSFASGGGDTYISHVAGSGTLENGKRVYELDEATDIENMSLLVDRQGDEQAHKIYASIFASGNEWRKEFESTEDYLKYKRPAVFDKLVKVPKLGLLNPLTNQYATLKFEPLVGTGAEPPAPSGGGGTFDYNELTNRPLLGGVTLTGDRTLSDYGLWNFGLATQSWVNTRFSSLPAWAMQPTKPTYLFAEMLARPTTLAGYGINDGVSSATTNVGIRALDMRVVSPSSCGFSNTLGFDVYFRNSVIGVGYDDVILLDTYKDATGGKPNALHFYKSSMRMAHSQWTFGGDNSSIVTKQLAYLDDFAAASVNHANTAGNANTVNGSHAWRLQSVQPNGTPYGAGAYDIQSKYNAKGDYQFYLEVISPGYDPGTRLVCVGRAYDLAGYTIDRLWRNDNANLTTVDWSCKKLTLAKFNAAGVATGTVTLTAETF